MNDTVGIDNKRIAKNSIILYVKLLVNIILGLVISRYVLQALGASNYGLYNVVAGVLTMITFISSSMSETTTRYINFEIGKVNGNVNNIFNTCQIIHIFLALAILFFAETIGIYYVKNILNVNSGMEGTAMFVFQISTISACLGIINAPYQGLLVAKENFATMARIEIFNTFLKLIFVLLLFLINDNRLRIYAIFMAILTVVLFGRYHYICFKRWPAIVKWNTDGIKRNFKEILYFNNYNILASGSQMAKDQGANLLINYFYGTIVNAAYSIAFVILSYINLFMNSFGYAAAPQITQNISKGNNQRSNSITIKIGKTCIIMAMIAVFPILSESEFVLQLWLGAIPPYTVDFVRLILILAIVGASSAGVVQVINGMGKIKWFKIQFAILCFSTIPIIIFYFRNNASPTVVLKLFIAVEIISRIIQLILLKLIDGFNSWHFVKQAYVRPLIIALVVSVEIFILNIIIPNTTVYKVINMAIVFVTTILLAYLIGFVKSEREWFSSLILSKLRNR